MESTSFRLRDLFRCPDTCRRIHDAWWGRNRPTPQWCDLYIHEGDVSQLIRGMPWRSPDKLEVAEERRSVPRLQISKENEGQNNSDLIKSISLTLYSSYTSFIWLLASQDESLHHQHQDSDTEQRASGSSWAATWVHAFAPIMQMMTQEWSRISWLITIFILQIQYWWCRRPPPSVPHTDGNNSRVKYPNAASLPSSPSLRPSTALISVSGLWNKLPSYISTVKHLYLISVYLLVSLYNFSLRI